jgi:Uma2 family endonuclease
VARETDRENDMTIAPERPVVQSTTEGVKSLLDVTETLFQHLPGYRPEIIGGQLTVTPPADGSHQDSIMSLALALAELHGEETRIVPGIGMWLPDGDDYIIPDLAVVDADFRDHVVAYNCHSPSVFRMVLEITSTNHTSDTVDKPVAYAGVGVPVYVIGDRKRREVVILTSPRNGEYRARVVYRPGESFWLPESIGAKVELDVDTLLGPEPKK